MKQVLTLYSDTQTNHIYSAKLQCMKILFYLLIFGISYASAQVEIEFWHSQDATEALIQTFANEFNASQSDFIVKPVYSGNYQEAAIKLVASLGTRNAPVLFDAEVTVFPRLFEEGALANLSPHITEIDNELITDIYPALWNYGSIEDKQYGLPWNLSTPVLFYNAQALAQRGVTPPSDWEAFEEAAARLTTRNTKGYIDVAAPFIFEALVSTRGGNIVTEDGKPNFDSPEAIDALSMLSRLSKERHSIPRGFSELDQAIVDFARTKAMMAIAGGAFLPQGDRFSLGFDIEAVPLPKGASPIVPLTGGQLVVLQGSSEDEQRAAMAFWQYLMNANTQVRWVQNSYFLPTRLSVTETLQDWYAESSSRRAPLVQLEHARSRPRVGAYAVWQGFLREAIERVTKGRMDPSQALKEAQQKALESD